MGKLGYCCLYRNDSNPETEKDFNPKKIMLTHFSKLSKKEQEEKLRNVVEHNLIATKKLLEYTNSLPNELKMVRISSDLLPLYTAEVSSKFYNEKTLNNQIQEKLSQIGEYSRLNNIRIGFHPDQFCVLASNNQKAKENGVKEFIYHLEMLEKMGFNGWHDHGAFINIHTGSKNIKPTDILDTLKTMPKNSSNFLTIENDEFSHGLESTLLLADKIALVLDIHHHWISTGEYIQNNDDRVKKVMDSWKGIRPLMHYSTTHEDVLKHHDKNSKPDLKQLKKNGLKLKDLRKHSEFYWNTACNEWAKSFLGQFDIECEAKGKNLASIKLFEEN